MEWFNNGSSTVKVKSKTTLGSSKVATTTVTTKVKQKKVYTLPGQRYDPPEEVLILQPNFPFI